MEKSERQVTSLREGTPPQQHTILVVDDCADLLDLIESILIGDGFDVYKALSGKIALSRLSEINKPSLILLDVQMQDMSGPEFLLKLEKQMPEILNTVPVVFLTAMDKLPISKAAGFIRKPFEIDRFLIEVHRYIERAIPNSHFELAPN